MEDTPLPQRPNKGSAQSNGFHLAEFCRALGTRPPAPNQETKRLKLQTAPVNVPKAKITVA